MARHTGNLGLRVDVPTLEPDAVLVDRLAAASTGSTPSRGTSRSVGLRMAFVATVVASLGATTWAAGAIPGVDTPFHHQEIQHAPLVPIIPSGDVGSPQSDPSTAGSPASTGLPGSTRAHDAHPTRHLHRAHRAKHHQHAKRQSSTPVRPTKPGGHHQSIAPHGFGHHGFAHHGAGHHGFAHHGTGQHSWGHGTHHSFGHHGSGDHGSGHHNRAIFNFCVGTDTCVGVDKRGEIQIHTAEAC